MAFTVEKGSEKGSQESEGVLRRPPGVSRTPPWRVRPLRRAP